MIILSILKQANKFMGNLENNAKHKKYLKRKRDTQLLGFTTSKHKQRFAAHHPLKKCRRLQKFINSRRASSAYIIT